MHNLFPTSIVEITINGRKEQGIIDLLDAEDHVYFIKLWDGRSRIRRHQKDMKIIKPEWQAGAEPLEKAGD